MFFKVESSRSPYVWNLGTMGTSSAGASQIAPESSTSCRAGDGPQPRRGHLACVFRNDPSSPAGLYPHGCCLHASD
jgi:hypothetical protein